jgi:hypothetical protein
VIKNYADAVEKMFLGFDRLKPPTHRNEQDEEDTFARELRKVGGSSVRVNTAIHRSRGVEKSQEAR